MQKVNLAGNFKDKMIELRKVYGERGITIKIWEKIINEMLMGIPDSVWRKQVEKNTPDTYLIKSALEDPTTRAQMLEFLAKKRRPRRSRKAETETLHNA